MQLLYGSYSAARLVTIKPQALCAHQQNKQSKVRAAAQKLISRRQKMEIKTGIYILQNKNTKLQVNEEWIDWREKNNMHELEA